MGDSLSATVVAELKNKADWFRDVFHTKEEIDARKLATLLQAGEDDPLAGAPGKYPWKYARGGLEKEVDARRKVKPNSIQLKTLSLQVGCDLPKSLFKKLGKDGEFLTELAGEVNALSDGLIDNCAARADYFEDKARTRTEPDAASNAQTDFTRQVEILQGIWQEQAKQTVEAFFAERVKSFADRNRYVVKAGAKLTFTIGGIVVSLVVLGTAATPAAPATLVPALIGLGSAALNAGKQIADLSLSAGQVGTRINSGIDNLETKWFDENGKPNKKSMKAYEFGAVVASVLSGGMSDLAIPSISSLLGDCGKMKGKIDGMEVELHEMSVNLNELVDSLPVLQKLLDDNWTYLENATGKDADKVRSKLRNGKAAVNKAMESIEKSFETIPELREQITRLREWHKGVSEQLTAAEKVLGTKNVAMLAQILTAAALAGAQFSSPPHELVEKITVGIATSVAGLDLLRELTPEAIEGAKGLSTT